jgi:hypothetical protein
MSLLLEFLCPGTRSSTVKQELIFVPMFSKIPAIPQLIWTLFGPPRLAVKPEAVNQEPVLVENNQEEER